MKSETQIIELETSSLIPADWNYKYKGTPEEIEKLARSISRDGSAGVFAVREVERDGKVFFEVIDGNHRLEAIQFLAWDKVSVENFGVISQARAVTIARRRNHKWFDDDKLQLSKLMSDVVIPEFGKEDLLTFMPDSEKDLDNFINMGNFEWSDPVLDSSTDPSEQKKTINLKVNEEVFNLWSKWLERALEVTGIESDERAFEFAIIEALNIPEEKLESKK